MFPLSIDALIDYLDTLPPEMRKVMSDYLAHCEEYEAQPKAAEEEKVRGDALDVKEDFLFAVIDQRHLHTRPAIKWYNPFTTLGDRTGSSRRTKKKGVCFHHTAVEDGFGARKSVVQKYAGLVKTKNPLQPADVLSNQLVAPMGESARWISLNQPITPSQWSRAMAVAGRMRGEGPKDASNNGVPYNGIRCANSVLVLNIDFEWVSWASNGANTDFLSFGWDANSTKESIEDANDLIMDGAFFIDLARTEGHPIHELTCHCAWTNKPSDPGAEFIRKVMEPLAKKTGCVIDYDFRIDKSARSIGEVLKRAA